MTDAARGVVSLFPRLTKNLEIDTEMSTTFEIAAMAGPSCSAKEGGAALSAGGPVSILAIRELSRFQESEQAPSVESALV